MKEGTSARDIILISLALSGVMWEKWPLTTKELCPQNLAHNTHADNFKTPAAIIL